MPTYDYRCERTGELFEFWQSFADDALTKCPETHKGSKAACGAPVKKVFSKVGISFKGDGFYKNDHGGGSKGRKSETSSGSDSSSSSDSSSDSASKADSASSSKATKDSSSTPSSGSSSTGNSSSGGSSSSGSSSSDSSSKKSSKKD